ncbi:hypothetical protein [Streptomyces sp. NPDC002851]
MSKHTAVPEPEFTLKQLQGDSARMVPHWTAARTTSPLPAPPPVPAALIHGVEVPTSSARLLDAMSDYGD